VVGLAKGQRPFRVHVDPMHDGAEEVFDLGDRIRTEFYQRIGFAGLLEPGRRPPHMTAYVISDSDRRPLPASYSDEPRHLGRRAAVLTMLDEPPPPACTLHAVSSGGAW
jgi:hypothetical protein